MRNIPVGFHEWSQVPLWTAPAFRLICVKSILSSMPHTTAYHLLQHRPVDQQHCDCTKADAISAATSGQTPAALSCSMRAIRLQYGHEQEQTGQVQPGQQAVLPAGF